jgi:hypothetical protein
LNSLVSHVHETVMQYIFNIFNYICIDNVKITISNRKWNTYECQIYQICFCLMQIVYFYFIFKSCYKY